MPAPVPDIRLFGAPQKRFVAGRDKDFFDYSAVDGDTTLDTCEEADADLEEEYFRG